MKNFFLTVFLMCGLATAQVSVMNIPALPPGATSPKPTPTPTTPAPSKELPSVTTLPTAAQQLPGTYTVSLTGPESVKAGEAQTWSFNLTNTGQNKIHMEYGACDVRFEVLNAAGEVVRPNPKNAICTLQLVILDAEGGETSEVQKIRWDGKDGKNQPVPAGKYTIRAKFVGGGLYTPAATLKVTVQ